jgi:hypothetical protein
LLFRIFESFLVNFFEGLNQVCYFLIERRRTEMGVCAMSETLENGNALQVGEFVKCHQGVICINLLLELFSPSF